MAHPAHAWVTDAGQPRPWREDARLRGRAAPGYPDDFSVLFPNPDSARGGPHELMWVQAIAYDGPSDLFLGVLLNQPDSLRSVAAGDNVVFRVARPGELLVAVADPTYGESGWPRSRAPGYFAALREGLRSYRLGDGGHNMPSIERCIATLAPAMADVPATATPRERFVGHYVLGRCLAEKYETERHRAV